MDTPNGERWLYRYDPFGRQVGKRCDQKAEEIRYLWDSDQIAEIRHYRHGQLIQRRHWVYNGWELVVQQRQHTGGDWETDFVTSSQNGTPQALFAPNGTLRWQRTALSQSHPCFCHSIHILISSTAEVGYINGTTKVTIRSG
ncbi:hypothetical protein R5R26_10910 [Dickeya zeae]|nr:hypothetical protein [Dickeya zeae]